MSVTSLAASKLDPMTHELQAVLEDRYPSFETQNRARLQRAENQIRDYALGVLERLQKRPQEDQAIIAFNSQYDTFSISAEGESTQIGTIKNLTTLGISEQVLKGLAFKLLVEDVLAGKTLAGAADRVNQLADELIPRGPNDGGTPKSIDQAA